MRIICYNFHHCFKCKGSDAPNLLITVATHHDPLNDSVNLHGIILLDDRITVIILVSDGEKFFLMPLFNPTFTAMLFNSVHFRVSLLNSLIPDKYSKKTDSS